ncbi:hypothetical protein RUMHYD_02464 [Blautia hydrogenotrophica DSM 10507]|uniref:Uncharacterized protein n=1 Tax=Blautia hydrogenotrophica (strain DSM 10507 / JCM 14656 / S5a33) TaxID=476272 RepID=C0CNM1_BLAHS|nr:hypothetical protein RUMHYD_02464 [Blautia hydrogenotrophica DSM 10507]
MRDEVEILFSLSHNRNAPSLLLDFLGRFVYYDNNKTNTGVLMRIG